MSFPRSDPVHFLCTGHQKESREPEWPISPLLKHLEKETSLHHAVSVCLIFFGCPWVLSERGWIHPLALHHSISLWSILERKSVCISEPCTCSNDEQWAYTKPFLTAHQVKVISLGLSGIWKSPSSHGSSSHSWNWSIANVGCPWAEHHVWQTGDDKGCARLEAVLVTHVLPSHSYFFFSPRHCCNFSLVCSQPLLLMYPVCALLQAWLLCTLLPLSKCWQE